MTEKTYGIVGLGLMGGSFARAIRGNILTGPGCKGKILALDRDPEVLRDALGEGIIDRAFPPQDAPEMLRSCDVVFLCLYPARTVDFLKEHRGDFKAPSIVTDISGVKAALARELPGILSPDFDFILGHPMAGGEKEGWANASGKIFRGRNYILMPLPSNTPGDLSFFRGLVAALGFSRIVETDCAAHDSKIAFTSQLCHVIACALVDSAEDTGVTSFGGGSFEDLTRIAMINAPLWTELFFTNKAVLLERIGAFEKSLGALKAMLVKDERAGLLAWLSQVREKRIDMSRIEIHAANGEKKSP
ncbi:MAG: prephenate dehydrogenase [Spirochaetaceae bacterium]|jgi:prephenate dehydrogenase|nr:prephenate dehydrogenase [Spirochaetaceae bacterium]